MKKALSLTLTAALAASALTPAAAFAAETPTAKTGLYNIETGVFYTTTQFKALTKVQQKAIIKDANFFIVSNGMVFKGLDLVLKTTTELTTAGQTQEAFQNEKKVTLTPQGTVLDKDGNVITKDPVAPGSVAVESVSAINATEVEVKFNKAVDKATLFTNGVDGAFKSTATVTLTTLTADNIPSGTVTGELSADGKTLTITSQNPLSKRYDVVIDGLKSTDGEAITKYQEVVTFAADKTAPTIVGTEKLSASSLKVKFSEPMKAFSAVTFKYADGTAIVNGNGAAEISATVSAGASDVTFTIGSSIDSGKEIIATFIGAQDQAGNLLSPNPATVTFTKGAKDGVAPTVSSLNVINNKTIEVKFSEELLAAPTLTGFTGTLTYTQDSTDKTKYKVTSDTANTGLKTVNVSAGYTDLSGETGAAFSKLVNFSVDTVAPKVASSKVVKVDGVEYLEVAFDEAVATEATLATIEVTGTKTSDFVTTNISTVQVPVAKFVQDATDKKVYHIALTDLLGANSTKNATYELTLTGKTSAPATVALVNDINGNVGPTSTKVSITRTEDSSETNVKATLDTTFDTNGIKVESDKTITVRFNQELDGASATDVNNYKFDGAVVEKAVLKAFGTPAGKQDVVLTLKDDSNLFTGVRNVTISGVKAKNGIAMTPVNTTEVLTENVRPTLNKAQIISDEKIKLTFSENIAHASIEAANAGDDFEVYVDGTKATITAVDQVTNGTGADDNEFIVTFGTPKVTDLTKPVTVKILAGNNVTDSNGNALKTTGTITVVQ